MRLSSLRSACKSLHAPSHAYQTALVIPLLLLCIAQAHGQLIVKSPIVSAPVIQSVPGTCADYNATLKMTGVQMNGASNPGHCAKSQFTPLFNGQPIGTNWQQLMLGPNPPKFKETIAKEERFQVCDTATDLAVDLSARVDVSELNWAPTQTIGTACTQETNRANTAPMSSAQNLLTDAQLDIDKVRRSILRIPDTFTECAPSSYLARSAVQQKIWQVLNQIATEEQNLWHDPEDAQAAQCAAKCNLCSTGWVGIIQCTADASGTVPTAAGNGTITYLWHEPQTWDVGGILTNGTGGPTDYSANFTSSGGGSKVTTVGRTQSTEGWTVNATKTETLTDRGVNVTKRFTTANNSVPGGIIWTGTTNTTSADPELQVQFNADQVGGNSANSKSPTADPTPTIPPCNPPQKPGGVPCTVACTWNLVKQ
jgi:hypothetical protein